MGLADLFLNNSPLLEAIQKDLLLFLTRRIHGVVTANSITTRKGSSEFSISTLGLLRFHQKLGNTAPIAIGFSQPDFHRLLTSTTRSQAGAPQLDSLSFETDLLKTLFGSIHTHIKSKGLSVDEKSVIYLNSQSLGLWASVKTSHAIQFSFSVPGGNLTFEIPIYDEKYSQERTISQCGFSPDSRILLVDDSPSTRKQVRYLLSCAGYWNIEEYEEGLVAYNRLLMARPPFQLVVADWDMSKMTGLDLLKKIRRTRSEEIKNVSVLLLTGERTPEEVSDAIREGVSTYIEKPLREDRFYEAMSKAAQSSSPIKTAA